MFKRIAVLIMAGLLACAGSAQAYVLTLAPDRTGHDEREDAPSPCLQETAFLAGLDLPDANLQVGGNSYGCDSEWAASFEFDLGGVAAPEVVLSATLTVTKTGYADGAQGFFYLGVYAYPATGAAMDVPRADLTPETALAVTYPPAANTAMVFDVTQTVSDLVAGSVGRAGFLLAGIYSEAGYLDWISVGGAGSTHPPTLEIELQGVVEDAPAAWSRIKALYR